MTTHHLIRRPSALPGRRVAVWAALVAAAVALRGTAGVLLGFLALALMLDAVLPMPGRTWPEADERFKRLLRARRRAARMRRARGLAPERLDVLDDRDGWASIAERRALGVQSVPLDSITGTVEELKARAFDRGFRPESASSEHWKRLWIAQAHGAALPPISVYRVGASHFVRDGHHRVSVARDHGMTAIEAEVVELRQRAASTTSRVPVENDSPSSPP